MSLNSVFDPGDHTTLEYIVTHVFCPPKLPDGDDHSVGNDCALAEVIATIARRYTVYATKADIPQWHGILQMLDDLRAIVQFQSLDRSQTIYQLRNMYGEGKLSSRHITKKTHGA